MWRWEPSVKHSIFGCLTSAVGAERGKKKKKVDVYSPYKPHSMFTFTFRYITTISLSTANLPGKRFYSESCNDYTIDRQTTCQRGERGEIYTRTLFVPIHPNFATSSCFVNVCTSNPAFFKSFRAFIIQS